MTKSQRIAQRTNEINTSARIAGLSYNKFSAIASIVLKQWPHNTPEDVAIDINSLYNDANLIDINDDTTDEIASFICDLWEAIS